MRYLIFPLCFLTACAHSGHKNAHPLQSLCGKSFQGNVVSQDPQDADWRKETLVLGPVHCSQSHNHFEMPLAVGENKSRTWIITQHKSSLELRHQHLLDDGSIDPVSDYGGFSSKNFHTSVFSPEENWQADFPADTKTIEIFKTNGLTQSIRNIWSLKISPDKTLTYELNREGRHFRAEFDLANPL